MMMIMMIMIMQVLDLMNEASETATDEGNSSDLSGYHSDSDSAVMMSGNSPFISKVSVRHLYICVWVTLITS